MTPTIPGHISVDSDGTPRVTGTPFKVILLIEAWKSGASTAEKLKDSYPQLTMSQIHAVLSYYYDHQAEIDAIIERNLRQAVEARASAAETPARRKLRDLGVRP